MYFVISLSIVFTVSLLFLFVCLYVLDLENVTPESQGYVENQAA